ncbi:Unknown protein sequence [Pseudomonas amygdali pv. ulmi]|uniref:Uncharacterized protein n=1 Tax=Pseudomonas amygdali pv. ulmi TaxID=251720 RepID=A0A0Q0E7U9_PSEA0|nr:Unknown protein sequence [Pseudomonas amygdali pv. ulmi]
MPFDPLQLDRQVTRKRDAGKHRRDEPLHHDFFDASAVQFCDTCRYVLAGLAKEGGAQASVGRIGLILAEAGRAHRPDSLRLAGQKRGQGGVIALHQRQCCGHRLPGDGRQTQTAAFGVRNEAALARLQPLRKFGRRVDPRIVTPARFQTDAQVGTRQNGRPRCRLLDTQHVVLIAPDQLYRVLHPFQQRQRSVGAQQAPIRYKGAAAGVTGAHALVVLGWPGLPGKLVRKQRGLVGQQPVNGLANGQRRHQRRQAPLPQKSPHRGQQHASAEVSGLALQGMHDQQSINAHGDDGTAPDRRCQ